ncbi:FIST C-terminal domain-containing protein [Geomonas sp. Red69]|uniref:FIST C-terminal domain-containing protein n=1 Tax=Geomonas diazotrophica TaxID=2843197 RepID=A0ABX8JEX0_9BACT|nr:MULTISPECIES: FIST N-terminal domain-containing protein [Geomonas]MBU5636254.1 FIST C-terminal domain-containing protein [Geomonas diazotrophica]QWV96149.1 FIST C-terminal domain-containing protein [Geomonas nitrogeniifigens]QXE85216.1 FIST C-terminal domain-containing protein [Geomonas nitrogeniifigens]
MGTSVGIGFSMRKNPVEAGHEAARTALERAGIAKPDFVMVFATVGYHQQRLIAAIREATSGAPLCGCSGEGIIAQEEVAETNFAVGVMAVASDEIRFGIASISGIGEPGDLAGERLAAKIAPLMASDSRAFFLLADGLGFDFDPFVAAFEGVLSPSARLPIFGGLAADNWASRKTYQYHDDEVLSDGACCVVMSGKGQVAWGINHGCVPVGTKRTITRCKGNIIYEIDGVSALEVLKEYLDEEWAIKWNKATLNLCLGFKTPEHLRQGYEEYFIRYITDKDEHEGSVTIQSDVSEGTELWIVRRDKELMMNGLRSIPRQIKEQLCGDPPKFVLQFECMGRGRVVFKEQERMELVRSLQRDLGEKVPWLGFYTYGEIGPIRKYNCFHNFTSVVTVVY